MNDQSRAAYTDLDGKTSEALDDAIERYRQQDETVRRAMRRTQAKIYANLGVDEPSVERFPTANLEEDTEPKPETKVPSAAGVQSFVGAAATTAFTDESPIVRARLTYMGFFAVRQTWDTALRSDGADDEVFGKGVCTWQRPDGSIVDGPRTFQTPVYGQSEVDVFGRRIPIPGRVKVGLTPLTGVGNGEWAPNYASINPWDVNQPFNRILPGQQPQFPVIAYEWAGPRHELTGSLTFIPELWEYDNGKLLDPEWGNREIQSASDIAAKIGSVAGSLGAVLGPWVVGPGAFIATVGKVAPAVWSALTDIIGRPGDRPIGQTAQVGGKRAYDPPLLAIDLAKAAEAAAVNVGYGPGVYRLTVKDSANIGGGTYDLFVAFQYDILSGPSVPLPTGTVAAGDDMQPGEILGPEQAIWSADARYRFVYQADGNVVLAGPGGVLWNAGSNSQPAGVLIMQGDGNLVVYRPPDNLPQWNSHTSGNPDSRLVVQNDGNVVIYRPDGSHTWQTGTFLVTGPQASGDHMEFGEVLGPEQAIWSADGRYRFVYQLDGNLVLYGPDGVVWNAASNMQPAGALIMQGDGNLVIYRPGNIPRWNTETAGNPGSRLVVQNDGNVVIYRPDGTPVWSTSDGHL